MSRPNCKEMTDIKVNNRRDITTRQWVVSSPLFFYTPVLPFIVAYFFELVQVRVYYFSQISSGLCPLLINFVHTLTFGGISFAVSPILLYFRSHKPISQD